MVRTAYEPSHAIGHDGTCEAHRVALAAGTAYPAWYRSSGDRVNHAASPLTADAFAALMAPLGPFEPAPRLAAAVSGGADSLALALLSNAWVSARGGALLALVVDHGLRPTSAAEAAVTIERL